MLHTLKILNVDTVYSQADNSYFLDVEVEVLKEGKVIGTKKFGYPIDSDEKFILADLKKVSETLDSDLENAEKNAKLDNALKNAEDVKKSLSGLEVK